MQDFEDITPGGVLGNVTANGDCSVRFFGSVSRNKKLVSSKTIYDCASLTKSVVTTTLMHHFIDQKEIFLGSSLETIFPEATWNRHILVEELLSHSLDFGLRLSSLKKVTPAEIQQKIFTASVTKSQKGNFINATSMVLGWLIERITTESLQKLAQEIIFDPLKMNDTSLMYSKDKDRTAPSEVDHWRGGEVCGVVHDESAWVFAQENKAVGSAGLFSTVPDLLKFSAWKLDQLGTKKDFLGWEQNADWMPEFSTDVYGKSGFTGCGIIFVPQQKRAGVLLMNALYPKRPDDRKGLQDFRREALARVC